LSSVGRELPAGPLFEIGYEFWDLLWWFVAGGEVPNLRAVPAVAASDESEVKQEQAGSCHGLTFVNEHDGHLRLFDHGDYIGQVDHVLVKGYEAVIAELVQRQDDLPVIVILCQAGIDVAQGDDGEFRYPASQY